MQIDWWTIGLQGINVLVLMWLLSRFFFRPVAAIVEERRNVASALLQEAERAKSAALKEMADAEEKVARLGASRDETLKAAAAAAEAEKASILAGARSEADRLRAEAADAIRNAQQQQAAVAADRASRLAVDIAAKVLAHLPDGGQIAGFLEGVGAGLASLSDADRAGIGADGGPVHLRTARPLKAAEEQACRAALSKALGRPVAISVDVVPDLIAGLEIETPHVAVRNTLRADLDRIATELLRNEPV